MPGPSRQRQGSESEPLFPARRSGLAARESFRPRSMTAIAFLICHELSERAEKMTVLALRDDLRNRHAVHIRQPHVAAIEPVGELPVIDPQ